MNPFSTMLTRTGMWHTLGIVSITVLTSVISWKMREYDALIVAPFLGSIWWAMHMWHIDNRMAHDARTKRLASAQDIQDLEERIDALEHSLRP